MRLQEQTNIQNEAAEAFYGQSDLAFAEQIQQIAIADPRLIKVFQRTREQYLQTKNQ